MWTDRGDGTLTPGRGSAIHLHVVLVMLMTGHDITVNFWWARPKMRAPAHSAPILINELIKLSTSCSQQIGLL